MWFQRLAWTWLLLLLFCGCYENTAPVLVEEKIAGASLVAERAVTSGEALQALDSIAASWVAVIPYAFANGHVPELHFNHSRQWYGESVNGVTEQITAAHARGLKVMLKPHVWVRGDGWPGAFKLTTEEDWLKWEANYTAYILAYLKVADSLDVEIFCIGTEFNEAIKSRPQFWKKLAKQCRQHYKGKLTYAANWDNCLEVSNWSDLDYIGVDAYFPLSDHKTPSVDELRKGWEKPRELLKELSEKHAKPILFTEYGYRSSDFAAARHWELNEKEMPKNLQAQENAYQALFAEFWDEPWFAGGFLWKWFPRYEEAGGVDDNDYTPQNKPVERIIRKWYSRSH